MMTGTSSGRAASGGDLAPEPPRATRSTPESIRTVAEICFVLFWWPSTFPPKFPQFLLFCHVPDFPHWPVRTARSRSERTARLPSACRAPDPPERARVETGRADQLVSKRREFPGSAIVHEITPASLGYPLSVFNKNSTIKVAKEGVGSL